MVESSMTMSWPMQTTTSATHLRISEFIKRHPAERTEIMTITITGSLGSLLHDYLTGGNNGVAVVPSSDMKTAGQRSDTRVISLFTQLSKALNRRTSEELLGMRLRASLALGSVRDHPGTTQHELERAMLMD